jgi:acetyl-CoA acetyltransferase
MLDPRVAGAGVTDFGEHPERTGRDLFAEAGLAALDDAGVPADDVDALYFGNFMGELAEHQGHQGPLMAEAVGVDAPATRFEAACASAGAGVRQAVKNLRTGEADVILVGGAERMTNIGTAAATDALAIAADDLYEVRAGMTFPGAYGLMARSYFAEYGGNREDLAYVAVKNHEHALVNEHAQLRKEITVEDALDAPMVADPLGLYDACPITDGAAAAVLVSDEYADEHGLTAPVSITGAGTTSRSRTGPTSTRRPPRTRRPKKPTPTPVSARLTSTSRRSTTASPSPRCSPSSRSVCSSAVKASPPPARGSRRATVRCP